MHFLVNLAVHLLAVGVAAALLPGVAISGLLTLILVTVVLGIINSLIKPVVSILTLPFNVLTLGLLGLVINGFFIWLVTKLVPGFTVASFWWALAFSIVLSLVGWFLHLLTAKR